MIFEYNIGCDTIDFSNVSAGHIENSNILEKKVRRNKADLSNEITQVEGNENFITL